MLRVLVMFMLLGLAACNTMSGNGMSTSSGDSGSMGMGNGGGSSGGSSGGGGGGGY